MKVIFLDIDGVLNAVDYQCSLHYLYRSKVHAGICEYPIPMGEVRDELGQYFDPRCINYLEAITNYTDAKLVISSTWRKSGIDFIKKLWADRCLPGEIVGLTPVLNMKRGEEIAEYLRQHDYITNYCIIDDDVDMLLEQRLNFVNTNGLFGITLQNAEEIVKILNGK